MTKKTTTYLSALLAALLLTTTVGINRAAACGSYGDFDRYRVRRVVTNELAALDKQERTAGHFTQRRITGVTIKRGDVNTAVVTVDVARDFMRFTEKVSLVQLNYRWQIAKRWRVPAKRSKASTTRSRL